MVAEDILAILDGGDTTDVESDAGVELQCVTARCGLGVAKHDAYLLTQLVDEDAAGVSLGDGCREFAQSLAHESGLETYGGVAHLAFYLLLWRECSYRVDDEDVDGRRRDELVGNLQSLLTVVGL